MTETFTTILPQLSIHSPSCSHVAIPIPISVPKLHRDYSHFRRNPAKKRESRITVPDAHL